MRSRWLAVLFVVYHCVGVAAWTPPKNPDPSTILDEARKDADAGRYEDALARHLWYHENALKHDTGQYGVRLSFALSAWEELGKKYPPALEKLKQTRDKAGELTMKQDAASTDPLSSFRTKNPFHDFAAFNESLGEDEKTVTLFKEIDTKNPTRAKDLFDVAEPALLKAKEYALCGKYMDADSTYNKLVGMYHMQKSMKDPRLGGEMAKYAENSFNNGVATLVAVLVKTNREPDAKQVAEKARKVKEDAAFGALLDKALQGEVPPAP